MGKNRRLRIHFKNLVIEVDVLGGFAHFKQIIVRANSGVMASTLRHSAGKNNRHKFLFATQH